MQGYRLDVMDVVITIIPALGFFSEKGSEILRNFVYKHTWIAISVLKFRTEVKERLS